MSTSFNPYIQSWSRAGNGQSNSWGYSGTPAPSIFGALPVHANFLPTHPSEFVAYHIVGLNPNVLNASVVGPSPHSHTAFRIITDPAQPMRTIWRDSHRRTVAITDWEGHAIVEMPGLFPRQPLRNWLRLSSDRSSRYMNVRGVQYIWAPVDQYICLYYTQGGMSHILARVSALSTSISIELTQQAIQYGLLEVCILSASVFLSGQNID